MPSNIAAVGGIRGVLALLLVGVLLYWTYERLVGEGDDPTVRKSVSSDTGTVSMLVSGSAAVAMVAGAAGVLLLTPMAGGPLVANPVPVVAILGGIVVTHWIVEKEERE